MVIQIFVLSCSVHPELYDLHNQCLITACLVRGLQFSPKRCYSLKKKVNTYNFSRDFKVGPHLDPGHVMKSSYVKIF